jgi:hypothetical protein
MGGSGRERLLERAPSSSLKLLDLVIVQMLQTDGMNIPMTPPPLPTPEPDPEPEIREPDLDQPEIEDPDRSAETDAPETRPDQG